MAREKLTARALEATRSRVKKSEKPAYLWDTDLKGFGLYATPKGQVSWLVQKWVGGRGGKAKRVVLGHYPAMELDEARKAAASTIGDVGKGIDIVDRKAKVRIAKRDALNAVTLGDAVSQWVKRNGTGNRYWTELERRLEAHVIEPLGKDRTVLSLTKAELRDLIETKEDAHPGAARLVFAALRPFLKWCVEREIIAVSPLDGLTPPTPGETRDRILSDAELVDFWKATSDYELFGPLYRLLLLTAQRRDEVAGMRWEELDLQGKTWTIPKERTKNGKEHLVHLSQQALEVLAGLPRTESDFVFTTTGETPISGFSRGKAKLDTLMVASMSDGMKAGETPTLKPFRIHDLRRTAASGMAKLGFQPHVIERVLNHISGATGGLVGVYQRYEYLDDRKRALEAWGSLVYQLATDNDQAQAKVLQLNQHRP